MEHRMPTSEELSSRNGTFVRCNTCKKEIFCCASIIKKDIPCGMCTPKPDLVEALVEA